MSQPVPSFVGMENLNGNQAGGSYACTYSVTAGGGYEAGNGKTLTVNYWNLGTNGQFNWNATEYGSWVTAIVSGSSSAVGSSGQYPNLCVAGTVRDNSFGYIQTAVTAQGWEIDDTGYYEWLPVMVAIVGVAVGVYFLTRAWDKFKEVTGLLVGDDASEPWEHDPDYAEWHEERYGAEPLPRKRNWSRFHGL